MRIKIGLLLTLSITAFVSCALSGSIVDYTGVETSLKSMELCDSPYVKVYSSGIMQKVPLKSLQSIKFDPAQTITHDRELYYAAEVSFKNGTRISMTDKNGLAACFVSIQNTLKGINKGTIISVQLSNANYIYVK